jgi:hypothetical protein
MDRRDTLMALHGKYEVLYNGQFVKKFSAFYE